MKSDQESSGELSVFSQTEGPEIFPQTLWTVVLQAQSGSEIVAFDALNKLFAIYWHPVYAYIRRHGAKAEDAEDLTQDYFRSLLNRDFLLQASREKGKLRAFLLTDLKYFLSNRRREGKSIRKGGGVAFIPISQQWAEDCYGFEPADNTTPSEIFERRWAMTILSRVHDEVRGDYAKRGREDLFEILKQYILWNSGEEPYSAVAARLGRDENYVKQNVHRLRKLYRKTLEAVVSETVESPDEVEAEIRHLAAVMG